MEDVCNKKRLIVLTGPTAVGKTNLSIKLAKLVDGEIISADSMQVYKGMDIGTAKIKPEEMQGVKHHLIDVISPQDEFNVNIFKNMAKDIVDDIISRGKVPVIVGGTGFYIQSVIKDVDFTEHETDHEYRNYLQEYADKLGRDLLYNMLEETDPEACKSIHPNNVKRVIRALEYYHMTGEMFSEHNKREASKQSPYNYAYFVLNDNRKTLYDRIDRRVDIMFEEDLVNEVQGLLDMGLTKDMVSMQGLGYKEVIDYILGNCSYEDMVYILKRATRHFAKRQLTWFGREKDVIWLDKEKHSDDEILDKITEVLKEKKILL